MKEKMTCCKCETKKPSNKDLDRSRRLARRRMAWISFIILILFSSAIMTGIFMGGEIMVNAISTGISAIVGIYTVFTSIVLGYLGVSVTENLFKK